MKFLDQISGLIMFYILKGNRIECLTDDELILIETLRNALEIVFVGSMRIGKDLTNLSISDRIMEFT